MRRRKPPNPRTKNLTQGTYEVVNKHKYATDKNPRYLSSYELAVFRYLDHHPDVVLWGSENIVVPYYNPVKQRKARYLVDVYVKYQDRNGNVREEILEIKPHAQTKEPVRKSSKKRMDVFESEQMTYIVNQAKWAAAEKYAEERGWIFRVITEYQIFRK